MSKLEREYSFGKYKVNSDHSSRAGISILQVLIAVVAVAVLTVTIIHLRTKASVFTNNDHVFLVLIRTTMHKFQK